ncbi:MAG TPA: hypothetical protein VHJ34_02395 [Actinomycetota bacterium]|nr:hypothetical protein [Actinomycetota bacterium]
MDVALGIAGVLCLLMALGHTVIGVVWVLPGLARDRLPTTPFGSRTLTEAMIRVAWYVVTIFATTVGAVLVAIAWDSSELERFVLRSFAMTWLAAAVMAAWVTGRSFGSPRAFVLGIRRLPVPLLWIVVAAICWQAST